MEFENVKYEVESNKCLKGATEIRTVLCAAVGTASWLAACTVYGDRTVCSCRYSKLVSSMYCVWRPHCVQL